MEKKSATLPYLLIENAKRVSTYESGNFVKMVKNCAVKVHVKEKNW